MRLCLLGSPAVAATTLAALVGSGHEVVLAVTAPDRRRGRREQASATPVKATATALGVPVSEHLDDVVSSGAELGVVVAYGRIVPGAVLAAVPMVNLHFSLLPRWRGAAPVERAILAGDEVTGVSLMELEEGLDTGRVYARGELEIGSEETAAELTVRLGEMATGLLLEALSRPGGLGGGEPQHGEASYARKLTADELRLDFSRPASELGRLVRVGPAFTTFRRRRLVVRRARGLADDLGVRPGTLVGSMVATGSGALELVEVQSEGRAVLGFAAWAAGARPEEGERLGEDQ